MYGRVSIRFFPYFNSGKKGIGCGLNNVQKLEDGEILSFCGVSKCDGYPADGSDEDNTYAKFSPSASCEIFVANPALFSKFEPGQKYYVDFTPAPKEG